MLSLALRSIWSKTLRDYRVPILGWGIGMALLLLAQTAAVNSLLNTPAARAAAVQLANSFRFFGEPVAVGTPLGYVTWKTMGFAPILLGIWGVLAGAGIIRGEEERGALDLLLAEPTSRARILAEKILALALALLLMGLIIALGALVGEAALGKDPSGASYVNVGGALLAGLDISLITFFFAMLALAIGQCVRHAGAAAGIAGAILAFSYLLDGTGLTIQNGEWLRRISPYYYYSISKPLIPTYGANFGAMVVLLALGVGFAAVSFVLWLRRDIGGVALPSWQIFPQRTPQQALAQANRDISVRAVWLRSLASQRASTFWWIVGLGIWAVWMTLLAHNLEQQLAAFLSSSPATKQLLGGANLAENAGIVSGLVFAFLPVATVFFALIQATAWGSDLDRGRVEITLAEPISRWRMTLERFGATLIMLLLAPLAIWLCVLIAAQIAGLHLDAGNVAAASFGIIPMELLAAALAYALAGRMTAGIALGIIGGLVGLSYFADFLQPLLKLPDWLVSLSIFHQYGQPMLNGASWGPWLVMTAIAAILLGVGVYQFSRIDVR